MEYQELETLLGDDESDRVERTESLTNTDKFAEAICAFANDMANSGQPGYLFLGAKSDGSASGAQITDQLLQNLAAIRSEGHIQPLPVMTVQRWRLRGGDMAVIEVQPCDLPPVRYRGRVWIRVGPRRTIASAQEERLLTERRVHRSRTWDARPCPDATMDDLALDLFTLNYRQYAVDAETLEENDRPLDVQLASLRFFDLSAACPTHAGVLMFAKDPQAFCPGDYLQYVRYAGPNEAEEVLQEQRITGDLLSLMREADRLIERFANRRPILNDNQTERTIFDYPPRALHELFMNALIHRNYESSTTPVVVNHFDDRIEVINPGGLYGDLTLSQFPEGTAYRNPVIAEAAKTLGFVNRFGRGIKVAQDALRRNDSPELDLQPSSSFFRVVVSARP